MKKLLVLFALFCLVFSGACAAGKIQVDMENFYLIQAYSNYGCAFAKVTNTGDRMVKINAALLEVYNADGEALSSEDYFQSSAQYLEPGEMAYVRMRADIQQDDMEAVDDYMLTITGKSEKDTKNLRLPCTDMQYEHIEERYFERDYLCATVTNNTDQIVYGIDTDLVALDSEGKILYIDDESTFSDVGLMPGSSLRVRVEVPSAFMDYYKASNISIAAVDAVAAIEVKLN